MTASGVTPGKFFCLPSDPGSSAEAVRVLSGLKLTGQSERNVRVGPYYVSAYTNTGDHYASLMFMRSFRDDVDSFVEGLVQFRGPFHVYFDHPRKSGAIGC